MSQVFFSLLDMILENSQGKSSKYIVSQYDQRKWEVKNKPRDFPPGHRDVEAYLDGHGPNFPGNFDFWDVLKAIHSTPSLQVGQVWNFRDDYQISTRYGWQPPSTQQLGGYNMMEYKNLQFLKVLDSGNFGKILMPCLRLRAPVHVPYVPPVIPLTIRTKSQQSLASHVSCPKCEDYNQICKDMQNQCKPNNHNMKRKMS